MSAGIAEALVVTALGLLVAIPAVLIFNYLTTRADALQLLEQAAASSMTTWTTCRRKRAWRRTTRRSGPDVAHATRPRCRPA